MNAHEVARKLSADQVTALVRLALDVAALDVAAMEDDEATSKLYDLAETAQEILPEH